MTNEGKRLCLLPDCCFLGSFISCDTALDAVNQGLSNLTFLPEIHHGALIVSDFKRYLFVELNTGVFTDGSLDVFSFIKPVGKSKLPKFTEVVQTHSG